MKYRFLPENIFYFPKSFSNFRHKFFYVYFHSKKTLLKKKTIFLFILNRKFIRRKPPNQILKGRACAFHYGVVSTWDTSSRILIAICNWQITRTIETIYESYQPKKKAETPEEFLLKKHSICNAIYGQKYTHPHYFFWNFPWSYIQTTTIISKSPRKNVSILIFFESTNQTSHEKRVVLYVKDINSVLLNLINSPYIIGCYLKYLS